MTTATSFRECEQIIINELSDVLSNVDENQIDELVDLITGARKVFFRGRRARGARAGGDCQAFGTPEHRHRDGGGRLPSRPSATRIC